MFFFAEHEREAAELQIIFAVDERKAAWAQKLHQGSRERSGDDPTVHI
jgi:hypothetical protein